MRCPKLTELPPPPPGKTGWPWTEESPQLPDTMPDGRPWPKISIVTPSLNQGQFIEETIRSVLLQGYPNLEYIIMDGESTDCSIDIIRKYEKWLGYWSAEKDRGQADALNKGFSKSTGSICVYLNSDDLFLPQAFSIAALHAMKDVNFKWLASSVLYGQNLKAGRIWQAHASPFPLFVVNQTFAQQGVFWNADIFLKPYFDVSRRFCIDHKFFTQIYLAYGPPKIISKTVAFFRQQPDSKSSKLIGVAQVENQKLLEEIMPQIGFKTARKIQKEMHRKAAVSKVDELLSQTSVNFSERWRTVGKSLRIFVSTPYPLRDRIFISAFLRLCMRLVVLNR
jgi:glycosyltransferase involved in cell wall biosynthesis